MEPSGTSEFTPRQSDCRQSMMMKKKLGCFLVSMQQLQVVRLIYFAHFLELRDAGGLYVGTRDLPDTTRGKLVVIEASRVLFGSTFVSRVLLVRDTSEMCSRGSPDST